MIHQRSLPTTANFINYNYRKVISMCRCYDQRSTCYTLLMIEYLYSRQPFVGFQQHQLVVCHLVDWHFLTPARSHYSSFDKAEIAGII